MKQTADCPTGGDMEVFAGFCPNGGAPVVGRLVRKQDSFIGFSHGACISVCRTLPPSAEDENAVGTVLTGSLALPWEYLHTCHIPILMISELPERCFGRVALLDPSSGRLFVSPDLETLSHYASFFDANEIFSSEAMNSETDGSCLCRMLDRTGQLRWLPNGRWLMGRKPLETDDNGEERLYEQYCDIADAAAGSPVTVVLSLDRRKEPSESFRMQIRSIFRAAVYGRFSLLLEGFLTEKDWNDGLECIHRIFCELESEGREFNGYIPKGMLAARPIQLSPCFGKCRSDFVCLDAERMLTAMTGLPYRELSDFQTAEWNLLTRTIADALRKNGESFRVLCREDLPQHLLVRGLCELGAQTWYIKEESERMLLSYLREKCRQ